MLPWRHCPFSPNEDLNNWYSELIFRVLRGHVFSISSGPGPELFQVTVYNLNQQPRTFCFVPILIEGAVTSSDTVIKLDSSAEFAVSWPESNWPRFTVIARWLKWICRVEGPVEVYEAAIKRLISHFCVKSESKVQPVSVGCDSGFRESWSFYFSTNTFPTLTNFSNHTFCLIFPPSKHAENHFLPFKGQLVCTTASPTTCKQCKCCVELLFF